MRALIALTLVACASTDEAHAPRAAEEARAWFGVRGVPCEKVVPALGAAAALRGGTVSPWRVSEQAPWCAVAPTQGSMGLRIDSLAQRVSASLGAPALAFYVARGAWSFTVFDAGEPVLGLESHVGEPLLSGDAVRAGGLLEVAPDALTRTADMGKDFRALDALALAIGLRDPGREARLVEAERHAPAAGPTPGPARLPPGAWAALPPLGVVLVKAVELRPGEGGEVPTYVIVDDMTTLSLPVARAEAMGLRPLASREEVMRALGLIEGGVDAGDRGYDAQRVKGWLDALGTGDLMAIARVYATLCDLADERRLSQVEAALQATSRDWLAEEIATVRESPVDAIDARLRSLCE